MDSKLFRLNVRDFVKGLVMTVGAAVLVWLANIVNIPGFDGAIDWNELIKIAVTAGITYLGKNLLTNSSGRVGGVI